MRRVRLPGWVRGPGPDGSTEARVRAYLVLNLGAIWLSVVFLVVLDQAIGTSASLRQNIVALVLAGFSYGVALVLARREHLRGAAATALVATWFVAFSLAWATPFTTPVALLVLHVPSLILTDALGLRLRTALLTATIGLTGALVALGEWRRAAWTADHPDLPMTPLLVGFFTVVVAAVLVLGIRDAVLRLARSRDELEDSRARLAGASIEARREIERDLHDGAQQRLTTLAVDLGRLGRAVDRDPEQARALVAAVQEQLAEAIRELRDLAHGIYPPLLAERGLAGALPAAARRTTLPCVVEVELRGGRPAPEVEAAVYFCCLEAMQNADRHSGGSLISVSVDDEHGLRFSVSDDGCGFDAAARADASGITGMRDRIQSAGGVLEVHSVPEVGTSVVGVFPPRSLPH